MSEQLSSQELELYLEHSRLLDSYDEYLSEREEELDRQREAYLDRYHSDCGGCEECLDS